MSKDIQTIKTEIYDFAREHELFKNNSFAEACYKLTCVTENAFLQMVMASPDISATLYDAFQHTARHAYRQALKDAYRFCDKNKSEIKLTPSEKSEELAINQLYGQYALFNDVRNHFEQAEKGRYKLTVVSDTEITFDRKQSARSINAELYNRWTDRNKPELEKRRFENLTEAELARYMYMPFGKNSDPC